jgi:hypothetical protein
MERKKFLMDVLEDLQKDVKEQLDYVQDIPEDYDTDDIEQVVLTMSETLYKYLKFLKKV